MKQVMCRRFVSLLRLEGGHLLLFHTGMKVPLMQAPANIFYKWLKLKQKNNNSWVHFPSSLFSDKICRITNPTIGTNGPSLSLTNRICLCILDMCVFISHCVLNELSRCKFCKNRFFNTFFPLSHTCHFETRPSPLSKMKENAFGARFLQLYRKNEYGDPHFVFHDFNKDSPFSFDEKKIGTNLCSVFSILLNCTDWAITDRIARVQCNSTLERKVKTRAPKGIFLVRKLINNTLNSVRYHMHHRKNLSFLSSFGLRAKLYKGS